MLAFLISSAAAQPNIDYAEYYFDTDPGPGNGTSIALPGASPVLDFDFTIPKADIAALSDGFHKLVCRFRDDEGDWSVAFVKRFRKGEDTIPSGTPDIVAAEYYIDSDPGQGNGTAIAIPDPANVSLDTSFDIPKATIDALSLGWHRLVCRTQDSEGDWSVAFVKQINRVEPLPVEATNPEVDRIEYQWLIEGEAVGDTVTLSPDAPAKVISFEEMVDINALPGGGIDAVLRMTPFDTRGRQGWPAFKTVNIVWLDDDEDGLPTQWEDLYEGFDPLVANDINLDTDEDDLTDYEEFLAGTDPTKKDSDGDGVYDGAELLLAEYGFDPAVDDSEKLENLEDAAYGTGMFANLLSTEFDRGVDDVLGSPAIYNLFTESEVDSAATAARTIINVSARVKIGGDDKVIPGFVVLGQAKKLLIRAVGPKLADLNVGEPLPDPSFEIFKSRFDGNPPDLIDSVDDWGEEGQDVEAINAAIATVGAFPLEPIELFQNRSFLTVDEKSAAAVVVLEEGVYTVVVRSADGETGEVLVEAYEVKE